MCCVSRPPLPAPLPVQVSDMLLGGKDLAFYQYNGDVNTLLDGVSGNLFGVGGAHVWCWWRSSELPASET